MRQSSEPAGKIIGEKADSLATIDKTQHGDEIIIVIQNGVVVKFEQRKIHLENGNV